MRIGNLEYKIDQDRNDCVLVVGLWSNMTNIKVPSEIKHEGKTYKVIGIGKHAFYKCSSLTSVTIPSSVTSIGEYAFAGCANLSDITIPSSVTSIGRATFCNCSGLISIIIPSSVTSIGDSAFELCKSLKEVKIPSSITSIGAYTFSWCNHLTKITIPQSVKEIGAYAFYNCVYLKNIEILSHELKLKGSSLSNGGPMFDDVSDLESITLPEKYVDDLLLLIGKYRNKLKINLI